MLLLNVASESLVIFIIIMTADDSLSNSKDKYKVKKLKEAEFGNLQLIFSLMKKVPLIIYKRVYITFLINYWLCRYLNYFTKMVG